MRHASTDVKVPKHSNFNPPVAITVKAKSELAWHLTRPLEAVDGANFRIPPFR
jgi:hypothetical protein